MILFEEEKSKLLLGGMPYLRPLYIKGVLSMYEILSISWNESLIDLKKKYEHLQSNKEKVDKSNNKDSEIKELNNKMFLIFSFMNHFYQMINKGKLKKFEGLDYVYSKLNNFFTLCRKIISYKILDINLEEFNQTKIILKLIIHVKLFLIFCEYDTYQSKEEFIQDILLIFNPKEFIYKNNNNINNEEKDMNDNNINENEDKKDININITNKEKEDLVIQKLIKEIKLQNINFDNINIYTEKIYNSLSEKYKNFINEDKCTFMTILYDNYFDSNSKEEENSDEEDNNKKEQKTGKKKKRKKKNKKKKNKNQEKNENEDIKINNDKEKNEIKNEIKDGNEIKDENKVKEKENQDNKNDKLAKINEKITMFKTIQSIAKMVNKLINNMSFGEESESQDSIKDDNKIILSQSKTEFDEIKKRFLEPLIPYIKNYQEKFGNKKMSILSLLQCAFIVYEEKYKKEKEKLLKEIDNLKKAMNHMFIQIQLMGGGRDIFRSTLYYLILIFIPEEQNIPTFFTRVHKLINFFETKVNDDLNLIKNLTNNNNNKLLCDNMNVVIKRLHKNNQYVLFIKSIFFMYKFFNFVVQLNKSEIVQNNNDEINKENIINENSSISKMNSKNIKYNLPLIKEYSQENENLTSTSNETSRKNLIYPTLNFNDCFSSYSNFLDEIVTNEKTQIILEQVIQKIEKENSIIDGPKFEVRNLFMEKEGKKVFNLTGFDVQIIIHNIKKMKYKEETLENLVNSKTWEKIQQDT